MQIKSVADHLLYTALKTPHQKERANLMPGARDLARCKRMSYDRTALEAVDHSREEVSTPEILSHFKICKLPFDNVWLEGPHPVLTEVRDERLKEGYVLKNLPDGGFSIDVFTLVPGSHIIKKMFDRAHMECHFLDIDDVHISSDSMVTITVDSRRIDLNDEKLLKSLEWKNNVATAANLKDYKADERINVLFNTADFIARLIVMMNSKPLGIEGAEAKDRDELKNDRQLQSAITLKVPREVTVRPIKIDLARVTKARLQTLRSDEPRDNQGITSVCGHMCYPKKRAPYWMPPCDRPKLLPGDNRNAERQLRSTQEKLALAIQGGVPTRVIQQAEASLKKLSV